MIEKTKISTTLDGVGAGFNIGKRWASPARLNMVGKHVGKAAAIRNPTPRKINCGDEGQYARTARKIQIHVNSEVDDVFYVKDPTSEGKERYWGTYYVIMRSLEDGSYYLVTMPKFFSQNIEIGFEYRYDKKLMSRLVKGEMFSAGTIFGTSSRITENDEWVPGIEAKIAPMSDPDNEEDAIKISDEFAEKVGVVFKRGFEKGWREQEWVLLNIYGTKDRYQPFPLEGEEVREDRILFGLRRRDSANALVSLTKEGLMKPDDMYDELCYAPAGSIVTSIKVETERYKNQSNNRKAHKPTYPHTELLERYERSYNTFYNNIVSWYVRKTKEYRGSLVPISPELENFIFNARNNITVDNSIKRDNSYNSTKRKLKNIPQPDWLLTIEVKESVKAKVRHKMTGVHGDKVTIGKIIPAAQMPVDDYGNRADIIVSNFPQYRRQIFSAVIEPDINFYNLHIYPKLKAAIDSLDYDAAWEIATEFYETVAPFYNRVVQTLSADEKIQHLKNIARDENEFSVILDDNVKGAELVLRLNEKYKHIKPTKVTFTTPHGEVKRSLHPIPITTAYYLMLDKFGDDISAQSTPRFNLFGLPASLSKEDRARNFFRSKPNRQVGITEARLMVNQLGGGFAVRQVTLGNSPEAIYNSVKRILRAKNPFNIPRMVYPGEEVNNFSLGYIKSVLSDNGIVLRKESPEDRI